MKLSILSIHVTNFKGFKDNTFVFDGADSIVAGKNGVGKTSAFTAWLWLLADKDADLHSNPNIRPIGVEECVPRVEAVIDVDGITVNLAKQQKMSVGKPNAEGISKVTLTNSYEINSVPKTEKDFRTYLAELGIDSDLILPLSHTDVFVGQKANDMRKVLFNMASSLTEKEIVDKMPELNELPKLISNYTVEEITAMQKATLRKINEDYGKDGEILRAKIEGLESGKTDIDVSAMELGKADATRRLLDIKSKINDATAMTEDYENLSSKYFEAMNKRTDYCESYKQQHGAELSKIDNRITEIKREISNQNFEKQHLDSTIVHGKKMLEELQARIDKYREEYRVVSREEFDENTAVCPTCGQTYPANKMADLKAAYEASKAKRMTDISDSGKALSKSHKEHTATINEAEKRMSECNSKIADLMAEQDGLMLKLPELRAYAPVEETEEYKSYTKQIEELKAELDKMTDSRKSIVDELRAEETKVSAELMDYEKALATNANNESIDMRIDMLRKKQTEYEQSRADAEAILYEVELLSRRKNELLTDEINSHFKLVKFVLFDYLKNGSYTDCCKVTLDGKTLGESTNTGREVLAKIDIVNGLQNFYKEYFPVFLDGAECLSEETMNRIDIEAQLIMLTVSESGLTIRER